MSHCYNKQGQQREVVLSGHIIIVATTKSGQQSMVVEYCAVPACWHFMPALSATVTLISHCSAVMRVRLRNT
jgi:hypothetical protein